MSDQERYKETARQGDPRDRTNLPTSSDPTDAPEDGAAIVREDGECVGRFRLLYPIGEGGIGIVYRAEQSEPVRRDVAVKIIKVGMDTRQVVARFEAERQALAVMNHPNIAKVLDGGSTDEGQPFFAMEYVPGSPITRFCDQHRLDIGERLVLFLQVCRAIQHAHQKGIIHRDIKPSNVLVALEDGAPTAKVIDFGIAKATGQSLTEDSAVTQLGMFVGTPAYMSPEQADISSTDIDTTTDIYSLGVLLYELLVGQLPFGLETLERAGWDEMRRMIREEDPPPPSSRLSGVAEAVSSVTESRSTDVRTLRKDLLGDLDWIVTKALDKDRSRRYESAAGFAADVERHLNDQPVSAGPPSAGYKLQKFVRRHRVAVVAASVTLVALVLGIGAATVGLVRAQRAEAIAAREAEIAAQEAETADQTLDFMLDLFQESYPSRARGETVTVREILDRGATRIERQLADQPLVRARLMGAMGDVYVSLGLYDEAEALVEEALEIDAESPDAEGDETYEALVRLARLYQAQSRFADVIDVAARALAIAEAEFGPNDPRVAWPLNQLAEGLRGQGNFDLALVHARRALAIQEATLGPNHINTIETVRGMGWLLRLRGDLIEARDAFERALPMLERYHGPDAPAVADCLNDFGVVLQDLGDYGAARPLLERSLEIKTRVLPADHPVLSWAHNNLGVNSWYLGDLDAAERYYQAALEINERALGPDALPVARNLGNLAMVAREQGDFAEAEGLMGRSLEIKSRVLGEEHHEVGTALTTLGWVIAARDPRMADGLFERGLSTLENALGPNHLNLARPLGERAVLVQRVLGAYAVAEAALERALRLRERGLGEDSGVVAENLVALAEVARYQGRYDESIQLYERALAIQGQAPPDNVKVTSTRLALASSRAAGGFAAEADATYQLALDEFEPTGGTLDAIVAYEQAGYQALSGQRADALALLRRALELGDAATGPRVTVLLLAQFVAIDPDFSSLHGDPLFDSILADFEVVTNRIVAGG